jgi:hypothetical protein
MRVDVFACNEPEIEVDAETNRVLEQRMRTADEGLLVSAEEARKPGSATLNLLGLDEDIQVRWKHSS